MGRGIYKASKYIINCILDIIYPDNNACVICKDYALSHNLCTRCKKDIEIIDKPFYIYHNGEKYKCYSIAEHKLVMRDIVMKLKYESNFTCGEILANYMKKLIIQKNIKIDVITFVPISKKTYNKRGYNQAKVIAKKLSEKLDIPCKQLIKKVKETKDQIGLTSWERWRNVEGCFKSVKSSNSNFENVLLIDDVVTTGATLINCSKALKENGVKKVFILTGTKSVV